MSPSSLFLFYRAISFDAPYPLSILSPAFLSMNFETHPASTISASRGKRFPLFPRRPFKINSAPSRLITRVTVRGLWKRVIASHVHALFTILRFDPPRRYVYVLLRKCRERGFKGNDASTTRVKAANKMTTYVYIYTCRYVYTYLLDPPARFTCTLSVAVFTSVPIKRCIK